MIDGSDPRWWFDSTLVHMTKMNRYDEAIAECIGILWKRFPEQRFGQLLLNLTRNEDGSIDQHRLWNMENDELMRLVFDAYVHGRL